MPRTPAAYPTLCAVCRSHLPSLRAQSASLSLSPRLPCQALRRSLAAAARPSGSFSRPRRRLIHSRNCARPDALVFLAARLAQAARLHHLPVLPPPARPAPFRSAAGTPSLLSSAFHSPPFFQPSPGAAPPCCEAFDAPPFECPTRPDVRSHFIRSALFIPQHLFPPPQLPSSLRSPTPYANAPPILPCARP